MNNAIAVRDTAEISKYEDVPWTPRDVLAQVNLIQEIMSTTMKDGIHFGVIPGCGKKPSLLKAGAEKICLTFRLAPEYTETITEMANGHREYRVKCSLYSINSGKHVGQAIGSCTTMEAKYRYRSDILYIPVPQEYWKTRDPALLGGSNYVAKKMDGQWKIVRLTEHGNPADHYNTCLKMAQKRALGSATLTATAASDCFTIDTEDILDNLDKYGAASEAEQAPRQSRGVSVTHNETVPQPTTSYATGWRNVEIHFGKNKGKRLGDLDGDQIRWYIEKWMPKDYPEGSGKFNKMDMALRGALDEAMAERQQKVDGGSPEPDAVPADDLKF